MNPSTLQTLTLTPGESATYDPTIHGDYVLLSCASEYRQAVLVPYSYISNTMAAVACIQIPRNDINLYLTYSIPEHLNTSTITLPNTVLVCLTILTPEQIYCLLRTQDSLFYTFKNIISALVGWDTLACSNKDKTGDSFCVEKILSPLVEFLEAGTSKCVEKLDDGGVLDDESFSYFELIIECYNLSNKNEKLGLAIIQHPVYCMLIHGNKDFLGLALREGSFLQNWKDYLRNTSKIDAYMLSLKDNEIPKVNPLPVFLELLDVYAGFPVSCLNLDGVILTGHCVTTCCDVNLVDKELKVYVGSTYPALTIVIIIPDDRNRHTEFQKRFECVFATMVEYLGDYTTRYSRELDAHIISRSFQRDIQITHRRTIKIAVGHYGTGYVSGNCDERDCFIDVDCLNLEKEQPQIKKSTREVTNYTGGNGWSQSIYDKNRWEPTI